MPNRSDQPPTTVATYGPEVFQQLVTPDPGVRHGGGEPWDETTRPSAPAPDPASRYTAHEVAVGAHLVDVHNHLRGELDQIRTLVTAVLDGSITPGEARASIHETSLAQHAWNLGAYCVSYCRVVEQHHTLEDVLVFPHLRAADPALAPVIDRLEQEHQVIHEVLELMDREIVRFDLDRSNVAPLAAALDTLTDALASHLSYEERELVEPLARHGMR
ncbi:MAG: hemerythrin domain-containing protein [Gaiellales bacterium]